MYASIEKQDQPNIADHYEERIVIGGFGGQGVLLTGQLLTIACMNKGLHVTSIPSYGAEMRGGTARCSVVISNESIASPLVQESSVVIALNLPSMLKFETILQEGGLLIYNTTLIEEQPKRTDIQIVGISASQISRDLGSERAANIACIGRLLALRPNLCRLEDIEHALEISITKRNLKYNPINRQVLKAGYQSA